MTTLTEEGRRIVAEIAQRHNVSAEAATTLLGALAVGGGAQAQFNHPDLGGMGQWSRGGMIMVGDMFNNGLKAKVDALCNELSALLGAAGIQAPQSFQSQSQGSSHNSYNTSGNVSLFVPGGSSTNWWPGELGHAASVGAQNDLRYAYFPQTRRLAINHGGRVSVHDAGDHQIGGFSQQQGGDQSLTFTSQHGLVRVADLPVVSGAAAQPPAQEPDPINAEQLAAARANVALSAAETPSQVAQIAGLAVNAADADDDIFVKIERLADLHKKGVLTQAEFDAKKAELLSRI